MKFGKIWDKKTALQTIIETWPMLLLALLLAVFAIFAGGCSMGQKSWGAASSEDAFKAVFADPQSGNAVPEIVAGGGASAAAFQKSYTDGEKYPSMIAYSRRKSLWGLFSSDISAGNVSFVYIGGSDETPEDTVKILGALGLVVTGENEEPKQDE